MRNLSFQLEKTVPGIFLLQGWLGGILAGFVYTVSASVSDPHVKFFDALFVSIFFLIWASMVGVIKAILMWTPFRLFNIQVRTVTRVVISSIPGGLFALVTGFLCSRSTRDLVAWVVTLLLGGLPTSVLVGSRIKPWELFTFGSINVGLGRSEPRSVLGTLGTLPLRFLSLLGLATWVLFVVCKNRDAVWCFDFILWVLTPTAYLLFSTYVTFRSPSKVILFIAGLGANLPVAFTAFWTYLVYVKWESPNSLYVFLICASFLIAWAIFLIARLSVRTNNVVIPGSILSGPSLPRGHRHLDHQCLGSRFIEWQERAA